MEDLGKNLVENSVPWRKGARWQSVGLQGVVLAAIGIYVLVDKSGAASAILQLIALALLVTSLLGVVGEIRSGGTDIAVYSAFRAGIGATIGAMGTARWFWNYIDDKALRLILGWGLIAYAVIFLVGVIAIRGRSGLQISGLVISALTIVLGVILLINDSATGSSTLALVGTVFVVFGLLLVVFAVYLHRSQKSATGVA
ncbi:MAG: hypothetical protein ACR2OU_10795 [Thermomicrobiales bacterium]